MTDTGEDREIKERIDAKEAEAMAESKQLLQKSMSAKDRVSGRRRRVTKKETLPTGR